MGDQALLLTVALLQNDALADGRVARQHRLDLARLDPEAAHFHLEVDPSHVLEHPAGPPPR